MAKLVNALVSDPHAMQKLDDALASDPHVMANLIDELVSDPRVVSLPSRERPAPARKVCTLALA
jgi:hypothetical protein